MKKKCVFFVNGWESVVRGEWLVFFRKVFKAGVVKYVF